MWFLYNWQRAYIYGYLQSKILNSICLKSLYLAIAEELGLKVSVTREKWNVISCLENEKLSKMVTLNSNETNLHVISMGLLNIKVI